MAKELSFVTVNGTPSDEVTQNTNTTEVKKLPKIALSSNANTFLVSGCLIQFQTEDNSSLKFFNIENFGHP